MMKHVTGVYNYNDEAVRRTFKSSRESSAIYNKAIIYNVPDRWSFQHILNGIGPKLAHSRVYLDKHPDAKDLIQQDMRFDKSIKEIGTTRYVYFFTRTMRKIDQELLGAHLLRNPRRTRATHPKLWHTARPYIGLLLI